MISQKTIERLGDELYECMTERRVCEPLTDREAGITIEDAYGVSRRFLENRITKNRERVIGKKIGVTNAVVQKALGVFEPDFGFLTDAMAFAEGDVAIGGLIQPRAEAEIAFRLKLPLTGPNVGPEDVLKATDRILPCFEIVDSRIESWRIKIEDTISDNASCGIFILGGEGIDPAGFDFTGCRVSVYKNGAPLSEGTGAATQGSPLNAIAWLANTFAKFGMSLDAGDVILSGSLVPLEPIAPGESMSVQIEGLGSLQANFIV